MGGHIHPGPPAPTALCSISGTAVFGSVAGLRSLCASNRVVLASRIVGSQQLLTLSETSRADTNTNIATVI